MVQCYECGDRRAVPSTNRGLCSGCDPDIDTSEGALDRALQELADEGLFASVNKVGRDE